jgi:hypothetical protein
MEARGIVRDEMRYFYKCAVPGVEGVEICTEVRLGLI